ncbi:MAG: SOS response-associated peptidase [Kangiellaceae bacterium]|nr:SOS response-associated peptidase [Kangiellaceae bacterium]
MCGRFNVIDDPITQSIMEILGIEFSSSTNSNVCPTDEIATLSLNHHEISQVSASWGIKPRWSNKLLINAQSETVTTKKTFRDAFNHHRCVIPLSGWYEWKNQQDGGKQKYLFTNEKQVLFMAGIIYENPAVPIEKQEVDLFGAPLIPCLPEKQLVTLTTSANKQCLPIHSRMPLIIEPHEITTWLAEGVEAATTLLPPKTQTSNLKLDKTGQTISDLRVKIFH